MAGTYRMDTAAMKAIITKVNALVPQMQGELKMLNNEMLALFGTWKGYSSVSFQGLHANWSGDYAKLTQSLQGISDTLNKNVANTLAADQASTARG
jgi:WXG100 family type VII secretion target